VKVRAGASGNSEERKDGKENVFEEATGIEKE